MELKSWQHIKTLNTGVGDVKVGKWPEDDDIVYFTIKGLKPEYFIESDTWEFPVSITDLEQIIKSKRPTFA